MKMVIFKTLTGYKFTSEENYLAQIQDARAVTGCSEFDSAQDIIDYFVRYFKSNQSDFIVKE